MTTIDKNTAIGTSPLEGVTYNNIVESTYGSVLSSFLYTGEVINFNSLTSNKISFDLYNPVIHQKIIVRARVFTECSYQNKTLSMSLSGIFTPTIVKQVLPSMM